MKLDPPIPVLRIFDDALARAFYRDRLGFTIDWEFESGSGGPRYLQVSRGPVVLHLTEHYGEREGHGRHRSVRQPAQLQPAAPATISLGVLGESAVTAGARCETARALHALARLEGGQAEDEFPPERRIKIPSD